jgi:hypothetical protein
MPPQWAVFAFGFAGEILIFAARACVARTRIAWLTSILASSTLEAKGLFRILLRPSAWAIFARDRTRFVLVLSTNAKLARGVRCVAHHFPPGRAEFTLFERGVAEHVVGAVGVARQSCCWYECVAGGGVAGGGEVEIGGVLPNGACRAVVGTGHGPRHVYLLEGIEVTQVGSFGAAEDTVARWEVGGRDRALQPRGAAPGALVEIVCGD